MAPTVLLYNLPQAKADSLAALCAAQGVRRRVVQPQEQGLTLAALLGLPAAPAAAERFVPGEMMVLSGFDARGLDAFLDAFAPRGIPPVALKAVVTPGNIGWTGAQLYAQLHAEHRETHPGD